MGWPLLITRRIPEIPSVLLVCGLMFAVLIMYRKRRQGFACPEENLFDHLACKAARLEKYHEEFCGISADRWYEVGKIESLRIYPVMFGKMQQVSRCNFTLQGMYMKRKGQPIRDGMFVMYNMKTKRVETGNLLLSTIDVKPMRPYKFKLRAIGIKDLTVDVNNSWLEQYEIVECKIICGGILMATVMCIDCGATAATWLSNLFFGTESDLRLGYTTEVPYIAKEILTEMDKEQPDTIMISSPNQAFYRLVSSASMTDLRKLTNIRALEEELCPHIVVGIDRPLIEDDWSWLRIGNAYFKNIKPRAYKESDLVETPIALDIKLALLNCELYGPGHAVVGDKIYACNVAPNSITNS